MLEEGFLQRNVWQQDDTSERAFAAFCKVWGVGPKRAQKWVIKGRRTLDDVLQDGEEMASLGARERAGLLNASELAQRIPRKVGAQWPFNDVFVHIALHDTLLASTLSSDRTQPDSPRELWLAEQHVAMEVAARSCTCKARCTGVRRR